MDTTSHRADRPRPHRDAVGDGSLRAAMLASTRALLAADDAPVREAMSSVDWKRRGLLQRLTRA
jgi:hypothetical protein